MQLKEAIVEVENDMEKNANLSRSSRGNNKRVNK